MHHGKMCAAPVAIFLVALCALTLGCSAEQPEESKVSQPTPPAAPEPAQTEAQPPAAPGSLTWDFVDGPNGLNKNPELDTYLPQLTVFNSKLYAAWREMAPATRPEYPEDTHMQIRVAVFNEHDEAPTWNFVDGGGGTGINWEVETDAFDIQLTVFDGRLYAIWQEKTATADQIRVAVYNGDDDDPKWNFVDGGGPTGINHDPLQGTGYPQLTVFDGRLYGTWMESQGLIDQIRVAVYNGDDSAPVWTSVDGDGRHGLNRNPENKAYNPQLTVFDGRLYLAWEEKIGYTGHVHVLVFNGDDQAPVWAPVDGGDEAGINRDPEKDATYLQLTVFEDRLYATWTESGDQGPKQVRVAVYNGEDGAPVWTLVDGGGSDGINRFPTQWAYTPQLTVFRDRLHAAWYEGEPAQIRVASYNGDDGEPKWTFVDGGLPIGINRDPRYDGFDPQMTVLNDKLYVTWKEKRGKPRGHRVRVAVGK